MGILSFLNKKKIEPITIEKHWIPDHEIEAVFELIDKLYTLEKSGIGTDVVRFKLWEKISELFPYLNIKKGRWAINVHNPLNPYVYFRQ